MTNASCIEFLIHKSIPGNSAILPILPLTPSGMILSFVSGKSANDVFKSFKPELIADSMPKLMLTSSAKQRASKMAARSEIRIGMPRVLNMYALTPLFSGYFESLGILPKNLVYSKFTMKSSIKKVQNADQ